ncbi:ArgE/DapE family deacylase [Staphylococcus canis]|uniref:Probable succinyl-diaminopimelate desuccinylase n=1 Tax=Staphylococcus canis TaxID=2724942 RepID=A0ABS0TBB2_9STAP|nr:ArgE/DapE family deacylase [Staphylococcus canis]MBI5975972.1 ArgE/DapE family deacylase [Staphylococcus canis]
MSVFTTEDKVKILSDLVSIKTVNDNEIEVCQYLQKLLKEHGIESQIDKVSETRANLIAEIGEGTPVLGISGHMDVVSEGDASEWTYDPFTLTEDDGYLYGRGSGDMKSGLAALVIAMIEVKESGKLKKGKIKLMATTGEEMEQKGAEQLHRKGFMDEVDALVIAEPSETMLVYAHKGSMDYRITSKGLSSHSSMPVLGKNSIQPLMQFIQNIDHDYQELVETLKPQTLDFKSYSEFVAQLLPKDSDIDLAEVEKVLSTLVISNTLINGGEQVNSIPARATADFNIRTIPEYDNDAVKALFQKHLDKMKEEGHDFSEDLYLDLDPVITTGDNRLIKLGHEIGTRILDQDLIIAPTVGVTDASNLLRDKDEHFSLMVFGPGERPHQIDERVKKDTYLKFIEIFETLYVQYLNEA